MVVYENYSFRENYQSLIASGQFVLIEERRREKTPLGNQRMTESSFAVLHIPTYLFSVLSLEANLVRYRILPFLLQC